MDGMLPDTNERSWRKQGVFSLASFGGMYCLISAGHFLILKQIGKGNHGVVLPHFTVATLAQLEIY
jgi:hypothetical protein